MDSKKKIKKVIKLVTKNVKDIKNVSRKDLSSAFRLAVNSLPNNDVREDIESQFESYLSELERRVSKAQREEVDGKTGKFYHILKTEETWKPPQGMSNEEANKIRGCIISQKLKKGLDIKDDLSLLQTHQDDKKVLMKLGCTSITLQSLKNIMNVYMSDCQTEVERALQTNNVPRIQQLADFMEECLRWFGTKYRTILNKEEKSLPTYGDIMACFCSLYMDMRTVLSRNLEKKEKKMSARKLCGFVSFLVPGEFKVDVLMQLMEFTAEDEKFIQPFVQKCLKDPKIEGDNTAYLKHILCIILLSKKLPDAMQDYKQMAQRIPAPSEFMSWIAAHNPTLMDSIPTDRKFVGVHITKFLLEDLDDDLTEQFLDVLSVGDDEETGTSEETPDIEVIEETETEIEPTSSALPVDFFIDKGKPKADPDEVEEGDEEMEEEEEVLDVDSGNGSNSPLILSDSEEAEPAIVVEDALDEIDDVLQNAKGEESELESEKEDEDVEKFEAVIKKNNSLDSDQRSSKIFKGTKKMDEDDIEFHPGSSRKLSLSEPETKIEAEVAMEDVEESEDVKSTPKPPAASLRTRSKRTSLANSQNSEAGKMKKDKTKTSDIEDNNSELNKANSPLRAIQSKGDEVKEGKGVKEKSDIGSGENDMAVDSMVSDSCDSDDDGDGINIPNIMTVDKSRITSECRSDENAGDFLSPVIGKFQVKPIKKGPRKRILVEKDAPKNDTEPEGGEVFTSIISPQKKSKKTEEEREEPSTKEKAAEHMTRRRSRRKTTSDLPLHSKLKDTKSNAKRKSLVPSIDCTPEKNSKITEYFLRTPIRTRGRVIYKDENEETNSEQNKQRGMRQQESKMKNGKTEEKNTVEKVRSVKTRGQSEKEDNAKDSKQGKKDNKKVTERKINESISDDVRKTNPSPKKSPKIQRRLLRSSMIYKGDQVEIRETLSSSSDSVLIESPKRATRSSKRI